MNGGVAAAVNYTLKHNPGDGDPHWICFSVVMAILIGWLLYLYRTK